MSLIQNLKAFHKQINIILNQVQLCNIYLNTHLM